MFNGIAAMEAIAAHCPTLSFLDIRMPGVSGLDVARAAIAAKSLVIFITTYDEYALRAFLQLRGRAETLPVSAPFLHRFRGM